MAEPPASVPSAANRWILPAEATDTVAKRDQIPGSVRHQGAGRERRPPAGRHGLLTLTPVAARCTMGP
jgi:hypothetical protein